jgi:hypothetical protein
MKKDLPNRKPKLLAGLNFTQSWAVFRSLPDELPAKLTL